LELKNFLLKIETIFNAVGKKDAKRGKQKNEENEIEAFQEEELIE
jgi:hypothetical protein